MRARVRDLIKGATKAAVGRISSGGDNRGDKPVRLSDRRHDQIFPNDAQNGSVFPKNGAEISKFGAASCKNGAA
jgi:hypothetical protein